MYEVICNTKAKKEYRKLPEKIKQTFERVMLTLKENPYPFKEYDLKKMEGSENIFRIRAGDYRLIYSVEKDLGKIFILKMGHK